MDSVWNFDLAAKKLLKFDNRGEFYIVEALCRPKKDGSSTLLGTTNNHTRMIRMWTFYSVEDFYRMRDEIIKICDANNARAYLLVTRRTTYGAMKAVIAKALKSLDNERVNFHKFITSTLCGEHPSSNKRWVFDIDWDDPHLLEWTRNEILGGKGSMTGEVLTKSVELFYKVCGYRVCICGSGKEEDVVWVNTKNGCHIVTPPFNLCECKKTGLPPMPEPYHPTWLKKDALTLLYSPQHCGGKDSEYTAAETAEED